MTNIGKSPEKGQGYAEDTVSGRAYRLDKFYRWVWSQEDRYTTQGAKHDAPKYPVGGSEHPSANFTKTRRIQIEGA